MHSLRWQVTFTCEVQRQLHPVSTTRNGNMSTSLTDVLPMLGRDCWGGGSRMPSQEHPQATELVLPSKEGCIPKRGAEQHQPHQSPDKSGGQILMLRKSI